MGRENPWGAPRIHGELRMLGFEVAQSTVFKFICTANSDGRRIELAMRTRKGLYR
jgi:hypothetical protein